MQHFNPIDILFWISCIFGSIYAIPQATKVYKSKSARGVSKKFIIFWFIDKCSTLAAVLLISNLQLSIKYGIGLICVLIIGYFKFIKGNK